jgi:hypothetical protein
MMGSLFKHNATENLAGSYRVGLTYQWEMLDCFLSPHTCNTSQTVEGILNFLNAAVATRTPVQITLDTAQFWYASGLWNWFDPSQPGYDPANVANVEWTGWSADNATLISWRNWGAQFRMPTPQPNLASPLLLAKLRTVLTAVVAAIRKWYEAQTSEAQELLVDIKLGEEVDVGVNFYYYPNGNQIWRDHPTNTSFDPDASKFGPKWDKGLSGGLPAQGYNMLRTMGLRSSGGPPTRQEITKGVQNYFSSLVKACQSVWPELGSEGLKKLSLHAGAVSDPLLVEWSAAMVQGAIPAYSQYPSPKDLQIGQPGLATALKQYDPQEQRFIVGESFCFGCATKDQWLAYFEAVFACPYGNAEYVRIYNIQPFLASPGALDALATFTHSSRPSNSCFSVDDCGGCWCPAKLGATKMNYCCNTCTKKGSWCGCGCVCQPNCIQAQ